MTCLRLHSLQIARRASKGLLLAFLIPAVASAQLTDFTELSLEQLSLVRISTLGRKQTPLLDTPAAASIITNDDIHRTGALDFAEALRMVPGLQVARVNSFDYAITVRGFNDATSNKLLVQMDGRSLYSTTNSGTYWNHHELIMEDVERIEVLRGPGASLWGANAMNGVINIVGRNSADTIGSMVSVAIGDELDVSAAVRHGWRSTEQLTARVYAKYQERDNYGITSGTAVEGWNNLLAGFRSDWRRADHDGGLTIIGEVRETRIGNLTALPDLNPPYVQFQPETREVRGATVSAAWEQPVFGDGRLNLFSSFEDYKSLSLQTDEFRKTFTFDLQLMLPVGARNEVIAGVTYRRDDDELSGSEWLNYTTPEAVTEFTGAFVQNELTIIPNRLKATAGAKIERNSFSGWEFQPSIRTIYTPSATQRWWFGASRAARTPSRIERTVEWFAATIPPIAPNPYPIALYANGDPEFDSEKVTTFEVGYRYQPSVNLTFDFTAFYNDYDDLRGLAEDMVFFNPFPTPHTVLEYSANNTVEGSTRGAEFSARWHPNSQWMVEGSVSWLDYDLRSVVDAPDPSVDGVPGASPEYEAKLRIGWEPKQAWSFDAMVRRIGDLNGQNVPSYTALDLRAAWHPREDWEIELIGRDVTDPQHPESASFFIDTNVQQISRSVFLRVTYRH